MIMRAKNEGNVIVFELEGHLDFETTQQFEETCLTVLKKSETQRIVFNMKGLKFVGSSGINQFIKVLREFNGLDEKPRLCHLSSEFQKVFRALQPARNPFAIYEDEAQAIVAFDTEPSIPKKLVKKARSKKTN